MSFSFGELVSFARGYRTYAAGFAAALTALAPVLGLLPSATAQALSGCFVALAIVFHRMATEDHLTMADLNEVLSDAESAEKLIAGAQAPPATIPMLDPAPK